MMKILKDNFKNEDYRCRFSFCIEELSTVYFKNGANIEFTEAQITKVSCRKVLLGVIAGCFMANCGQIGVCVHACVRVCVCARSPCVRLWVPQRNFIWRSLCESSFYNYFEFSR